MSESRSIWKTIGIWVGAIIILAIIAHAVLLGGTRRRLEAEIAYIKARHEPLTAADLAGPKVPDAENAALVYERAFAAWQSPLKKDLDVVEAFDATTTDPMSWKSIAPALGRVQPVIRMVADAQARPECQFPVDWKAGAGALFPHYSRLRGVARVIAIDAAANAQAGRMDEAVKSLGLAYGLDDAMASDRVLIGHLVRVAVLAITHNSMRACLNKHHVTEAQAKQLFDQLAKIDLKSSHVRAMQGERAMGMWYFEHAAEFRQGLTGSGGFDPTAYMGAYPLRPLLNVDQATYLRLMRRQVEQSSLSCYEMKRKHIRLVDDSDVPKYAVISRIMFPVFSRVRIATDSAIAQLALAQVSLAAMAYKDRFGAYPASIAELRSKLRWKLPPDPYSNKDLVYQRTKTGFLVYSLGPNMKDDTGVGGPTSPSDANAAVDIVWEWGL